MMFKTLQKYFENVDLTSATRDGIHAIVLVNLVLFLYKLHGALRIKKGVRMSYRMS